jgi:hypothetical protein
MAFGVAIRLNIALSVVSCAQGVYNIYISKYETACRCSLCYALRYVLDLCALYIYKEEAVEGCFFNIPFQRLIPKSNE